MDSSRAVANLEDAIHFPLSILYFASAYASIAVSTAGAASFNAIKANNGILTLLCHVDKNIRIGRLPYTVGGPSYRGAGGGQTCGGYDRRRLRRREGGGEGGAVAVASGGEPWEGRKHGCFNATREGGKLFPDTVCQDRPILQSPRLIN